MSLRYEPSAVQVQKKKILLAVLPDLKTDASCVATWQGKTLMTSAGPLKVPHSFFLFFINFELSDAKAYEP